MYAARAKWLHSLIHKASMNKNVSGFFDILICCVDNASWNRKPIKQRDLPASLTMDEYFPWKVTHCRHFFTSIAQWSVEEDDTIMTIMYGKFWFDGDFFGRYLDASVKLR